MNPPTTPFPPVWRGQTQSRSRLQERAADDIIKVNQLQKGEIRMKTWPGYTRGVNLGGWLSQCVHTPEHYERFIAEADIRRIRDWGLDHIRVPVDYDLVEDVNWV